MSWAKAPKLTGIYPYSAYILLHNSFIQEITPQNQKIADEKAKRKGDDQINIKCDLLTDDSVISILNAFIKKSLKYSYLTIDNYSDNYKVYHIS